MGATPLLGNAAAVSEGASSPHSRQAVHEETLLREHDLGRQITQLRLEKENLLDTVFLATSPTQIRSLWGQVSDLLGDELSQLQRAAMQIEPSLA